MVPVIYMPVPQDDYGIITIAGIFILGLPNYNKVVFICDEAKRKLPINRKKQVIFVNIFGKSFSL